MSQGRNNDVTFNIGADNANLEKGISESEKMLLEFGAEMQSELDSIGDDLENLADKTDQLETSLDGATDKAGELGDEIDESNESLTDSITKWARIGALLTGVVVALKEGVDWIVEWHRKATGLNFELERQKDLQQQLVDFSKERASAAAATGDVERLKEVLKVEKDLLEAQEKRKNQARERLGPENDPGLKGPFNPEGQRALDPEILKEIIKITEAMKLRAEVIKQIESAIVALDKEEAKKAEKDKKRADDEAKREAKKLQDRDDRLDAELESIHRETVALNEGAEAAERQRDIDRGLTPIEQQAFRAARSIRDEAQDRVDTEKELAKEREKAEKEVTRLQEKRARLQTRQAENLERFADRREVIMEKRDAPIGGFDRGLQAIGNRIADAASKPDSTAKELERLNKQQVDEQTKINSGIEKLDQTIKKLNVGGMV